jgi:radical SAM superfamily enzyme YgiQ (UPF0313 family)
MKIAIISTYTHPTRVPTYERSIMQSSVPELIASLCPEGTHVEIYNEKEAAIPLDRDWDLVFFSYLHSYYEHTKTLSTLFRKRGITTVAGGRHASYYTKDCLEYFDAVVINEPEANVPRLIEDFKNKQLQPIYNHAMSGPHEFKPYRYDLIDFKTNTFRLPGIEASRGCPFSCNFCVLTGWEKYRYRPVKDVVNEILFKMKWNKNLLGALDDTFVFLDNNLGGSKKYLRELCEALIPIKKTWGCALTFNILKDKELVQLMSKAGCRYIYTGIESLSPDSIDSMNKGQNNLKELKKVMTQVYSAGIVLSFGLIIGSDGDTNEYLSRIPEYLNDLGFFSVTFMGIVCPYPETPFFQELAKDGRLLPGISSRDLDGYTLCHRPKQLTVAETVEHYQRLCKELASVTNVAKHYMNALPLSSAPRYKSCVMISGLEITSIDHSLKNTKRTYIGGVDHIESWDAQQMLNLGLPLQRISPEPTEAYTRNLKRDKTHAE